MTIHAYVCGFEGGTVRQWDAATPPASVTVGAAAALSGAYGLRLNPAAAASDTDHSLNPAPVAPAVGRIKFEFPSALPGARVFLMRWPSAAQSYRLVFDPADNTIRLAHYNSSNVLEEERTGPVVASGQVIRLDFLIRGGSSSERSMSWSIDGAAQTKVGPNAGYITGFSNWRLGDAAAQTFDMYLDDAILLWTNDAGDMAGVEALFPLGDGYAKRLAPTGVGTHSGSGSFGTSAGTIADSWQLLDELPMDTPTGYVEQTTAGGSDYLEYTHDDLAVDETVINGVSLYYVTRSSGLTSNNAGIHAVDGGTDTEIFDGTWLDNTSPYGTSSGSVPGIPWTRDRVNALLSRWGYRDGAGSIPRLPSVHFEVDVKVITEPEGWPEAYIDILAI